MTIYSNFFSPSTADHAADLRLRHALFNQKHFWPLLVILMTACLYREEMMHHVCGGLYRELAPGFYFYSFKPRPLWAWKQFAVHIPYMYTGHPNHECCNVLERRWCFWFRILDSTLSISVMKWLASAALNVDLCSIFKLGIEVASNIESYVDQTLFSLKKKHSVRLYHYEGEKRFWYKLKLHATLLATDSSTFPSASDGCSFGTKWGSCMLMSRIASTWFFDMSCSETWFLCSNNVPNARRKHQKYILICPQSRHGLSAFFREVLNRRSSVSHFQEWTFLSSTILGKT